MPSVEPQARQTLIAQAGVIDEVNFFWYEALPDGGLRSKTGAENSKALEGARQAGIKIVPSVNNEFDRARVAAIIHDAATRAAHVQIIVDKALDVGYDGIDIDYEGLLAEDRDDFSLFIEELAEALHAHNLILSIAVHAKTGEQGGSESRQAQDWARLGAAVDEFKIMTYDYHWSTSEAGPIAPISWVLEVLEYAQGVVPPGKIYVGVHFYAYDWSGSRAQSYTWQKVQSIVQSHDVQVQRDEPGEAWFTYQDGQRTVYFADAKSLQTRLDEIVKAYPGIGGIAIWRLGGEDPENWNVIRQALKNF
jgi:spore germination protein